VLAEAKTLHQYIVHNFWTKNYFFKKR